VLTTKQLEFAKRQTLKELKSLNLFVKNGVNLHSTGSAEEKNADTELVRTALQSIENMDITQSSVAILISALHRLGVEAKLDAIFDLEDLTPV
jgi:hypothetical protein